MIKVVSFNICPFVQRVTATLEAKKMPYEIAYISLKDKPKWFLELSPTGQVPILITETGVPLFESDAIVEYIDDWVGPLEEGLSPEQKALDRAWSYQASKHYLVQCSTMRSADKDTFIERRARLAKAFEKAEEQLGGGPFFKGASLSKVDLAWLPLLHRAAIIEEHACHDFFDQFPKVKAWQTALLDTGLAQQSVPADFVEAFTGFYLSDQTYLGTGRDGQNTSDQACATGRCC